jgi:hypothetical protein
MERLEKTCKKHGVLDEKDILKCPNSAYALGYFLRCGKCRNERAWKDGAKCKKHGLLKKEDVKTNGRCKLCHRLSANNKRNNNREWFNAKMAEDRKKNPEKWAARYKKDYQVNLKKYGEFRITKEIARMHGLTHDQYEKMFIDQDSKCKICNEPESRKMKRTGKVMRMVVDHNHATGKVRGLLCHKCNVLISMARESIDILEMAILYLEHSNDC